MNFSDKKNHKIEDGWEKVEGEIEGRFTLVRRDDKGIRVHLKYFRDNKLQRYDLTKDKERLEDEKEILHTLIYYFLGRITNPEEMDKLPKKDLFDITNFRFWKLYNSYDNEKNLPHSILNEYAYFLYEFNLISDGIHFASLAFKIEENSDYTDTVGEGYFKQGNFDMAFSSFIRAVEIDKKNDSHNEEHIINYIKAALKTENLKSTQNGIDLLKENFTENKEIKNFEKELNSLKSDTMSNDNVIDENFEESDLEIYLMYEGTLFTYINKNNNELTFQAFRLIVECPDSEDYEWEVKESLGELIFTIRGDSYETYLITELPEDIVDYEFTNGVGNLHDEPINSIEEAIDFIKNFKTISFKKINPKDGENICYINQSI